MKTTLLEDFDLTKVQIKKNSLCLCSGVAPVHGVPRALVIIFSESTDFDLCFDTYNKMSRISFIF